MLLPVPPFVLRYNFSFYSVATLTKRNIMPFKGSHFFGSPKNDYFQHELRFSNEHNACKKKIKKQQLPVREILKSIALFNIVLVLPFKSVL